jgi:ABC-type nitrate/sulfonate/bicarbonate transport system substrate-binding protein
MPGNVASRLSRRRPIAYFSNGEPTPLQCIPDRDLTTVADIAQAAGWRTTMTMTMKNIAVIFVLFLAFQHEASSQDRVLQVVGFAGGPNWPLWVADEKGYFAAEGLRVQFTATPTSTFLVEGLTSGKFDIALAAIDNLIAYQEGQGEVKLSGQPDMFAFVGNLRGALHLIALPEIHSIAELRGKSIAVDARTTGFAFVLMKMLEKGGLRDSDYTLDPVGGTVARVKALSDRTTSASLINSPLEAGLVAKGYSDLGSATSLLGPYQGTVGIAKRSWAATHRPELVGFIRAYVRATDWLRDPAHHDDALKTFEAVTKATPEAAEAAYRLLLTSEDGIQVRGKIDMAGVDTVLKLRSAYGQPRRTLNDAAKYVDESFYREAVAK